MTPTERIVEAKRKLKLGVNAKAFVSQADTDPKDLRFQVLEMRVELNLVQEVLLGMLPADNYSYTYKERLALRLEALVEDYEKYLSEQHGHSIKLG